MAILLDGKATSAAWRAELGARVEALAGTGKHAVTPGLAMVWVGDHPASAAYVRNKDRAAAAAGIHSAVVHLPADCDQSSLEETLDRLAMNPAIDGILLQLPLPAGLDVDRALDRVPPAKDVDCLTPLNQGLLALGRPRFIPATPLGIVELLRRYAIPVAGTRAVIIGRSIIVGRPLATLLAQRGVPGDATVTLCHSRTRDLGAITREADLLIAASGQPRLVRADMVRPGATVIDVGVTRVPDSSASGGSRLVGDVDFSEVSAVAGAITPVPGGVGPMTVAALVHNTVVAAERRLADPARHAHPPAVVAPANEAGRW